MKERTFVEVILKTDKDGVVFSEFLEAESLGGDLYRLLDPPRAWWLGLGDVVRCGPANEIDVKLHGHHVIYEKLIESAGHQTVQVWFGLWDVEAQERITMEIKEAGFRVFQSWGQEALVDIASPEELDRLMVLLAPRKRHLERVEVLGPPKGGVQ